MYGKFLLAFFARAALVGVFFKSKPTVDKFREQKDHHVSFRNNLPLKGTSPQEITRARVIRAEVKPGLIAGLMLIESSDFRHALIAPLNEAFREMEASVWIANELAFDMARDSEMPMLVINIYLDSLKAVRSEASNTTQET